MKKYMITAAAFLLVAGMANAQTKETVKTTSKPAMTTRTSTPATHKTGTVTAAPSTPSSATTQKQSTTGTTIKRKHHTKKGTALKKTVNK